MQSRSLGTLLNNALMLTRGNIFFRRFNADKKLIIL